MTCSDTNTTGPNQKLAFWLGDMTEEDVEDLGNRNTFRADVDYRIDNDEAATLEWVIVRGNEQITLSGTDGVDAYAFLNNLRGHNRLRLRVNHTVYDFTITDLFNTPVQVNIDECGNYNPVL